MFNPRLVKASWGTAADAQINIVPKSRFFNQWNTVTSVNTNTGRIDIADSERHRLIDTGSWFWIEGVQEELDEPDEWFLDVNTGRLYYMPSNSVIVWQRLDAPGRRRCQAVLRDGAASRPIGPVILHHCSTRSRMASRISLSWRSFSSLVSAANAGSGMSQSRR